MRVRSNSMNRFLISLLIVTMFLTVLSTGVAAQSVPTNTVACQAAGGIWCDDIEPLNTKKCQLLSEPNLESDVECTVTSVQNVHFTDKDLHTYSFKTLTVEEDASIRFRIGNDVSTFEDLTNQVYPPFEKGLGSGSQYTTCSDENGGRGGNGGSMFSIGMLGDIAETLRPINTAWPGVPGIAGANIEIISSEEITIAGKLNVSGSDGQNGKYPGNADDCDSAAGDDAGCGGSGAGGGGGGGSIRLRTIIFTLESTGEILANGGHGGIGGKGGKDDAETGWGGDGPEHGGNGGNGGGGDGGHIYIYTNQYAGSENFEYSNGLGGIRESSDSCSRIPQPGTDGAEGLALINPKENDPEGTDIPVPENGYLCNDGIDNDLDFLIDMDDPDCHDLGFYGESIPHQFSQAFISKWDTTLWNIIEDRDDFSWYDESAFNGGDLSCGDDFIGKCAGGSFDLECGDIEDISYCEKIGCELSSEATPCNRGVPDQYFGNNPANLFACSTQEGCGVVAPDGWPVCRGEVKSCEEAENNHGCDNYICEEGTVTTECSSIKKEKMCAIDDVCDWEPKVYDEITIDDFEFCGVKNCVGLPKSQCIDGCGWAESALIDFCLPMKTEEMCFGLEKTDCDDGCAWIEKEKQLDLGYVVNENDYGAYACFDNAVSKPDEFLGSSLDTPGKYYTWRDAGAKSYLIMQASDTQMISNGNEWFYCDASGTGTSNGIPVEEYDHFTPVVDEGKLRCSDKVISVIKDAGGSDLFPVFNCDLQPRSECDNKYAERVPDNTGYVYCHTDMGEVKCLT